MGHGRCAAPAQPQRSCTWEKQSAECCGAPQAGAAEEEPCASGEKHPMSFPLETNENKQVEFSALREVRTTSAKREDTPMIRVEESNAPPKHSHGLTSSCEKGKCAIAATAQKNQPNNQTTTKKKTHQKTGRRKTHLNDRRSAKGGRADRLWAQDAAGGCTRCGLSTALHRTAGLRCCGHPCVLR